MIGLVSSARHFFVTLCNEGPVDEIENDSDFSLLLPNHNDECKDDYHSADGVTLNQIKEKFAETTDLSERILLLTLAPKS